MTYINTTTNDQKQLPPDPGGVAEAGGIPDSTATKRRAYQLFEQEPATEHRADSAA